MTANSNSRQGSKYKAIRFFDLKVSDKETSDIIKEIKQKWSQIESMCIANTSLGSHFNFKQIKNAVGEESARKQSRKVTLNKYKSRADLCLSIKSQRLQIEKNSISVSNNCLDNSHDILPNKSSANRKPKAKFTDLKKSILYKENSALSVKSKINEYEQARIKGSIKYDQRKSNATVSVIRGLNSPSHESIKLKLDSNSKQKKPRKLSTSTNESSGKDKLNSKKFLNFKLTSINSFTPMGRLKIKKPTFLTTLETTDQLKSTLNSSLSNFFKQQELHSYRELRNLNYLSNYTLKPIANATPNHLALSTINNTDTISQKPSKNSSYQKKHKTISNLKMFINNFSKIETSLNENKVKINTSYWQYPEKQSKYKENFGVDHTKQKKKQRNLQSEEGEYDFLEFLEVKAREPEVVEKYLVEKVKLNNTTFLDHNFISNNVARVVTYGSVISKMDNVKAHLMGKAINENYTKYAKDLLPKSLALTTIENVSKLKTEHIENIAANSDLEKILTLNMVKKRKQIMQAKKV